MSDSWTPQYLNFTVSNKSKQSIDADYWNALWNTVIGQADNNTSGVEYIFENFVSGVKGDNETDYRSGDVNIDKDDIGLGNVDNTADSEKSVLYAESAGTISGITLSNLVPDIVDLLMELYDFGEIVPSGYVIATEAEVDAVFE